MPDETIDRYVQDNKIQICVAGMLLGVGLISLLPFMGLTCRWCTGTG